VTPKTIWTAYNLTLIGAGLGSGKFGMIQRDNGGPNIYNSVVTEFGLGLQIENDGLFQIQSPALDGTGEGIGTFNHILFNATTPGNANANVIFTNFAARMSESSGNPLLSAISRTNDCVLDPRPASTNSPVYTNIAAVPNNGFFVPTCYRGAFDQYNWAYWGALNELGFFSPTNMCKKPVWKYDLPEVTSVTKTNGSDITVSFQTEDCLYYQIQCTDVVTNVTTWSELARIKGNGGIRSHTDVNPPGTRKFYRVRLVQE
jgi:hypothetical protein